MMSSNELIEKIMPIVGILVFGFLIYLFSRIGYSALTAKKRIAAFCSEKGFNCFKAADQKLFGEFLNKYQLFEKTSVIKFQELLFKDFGEFAILSMLITFDSRGTSDSGASTSKITGGYFVLACFKHLNFPKFVLRNKKKAPWEDILKKNRFTFPGGHRVNSIFNFYSDEPSQLGQMLNDQVLDHLSNYKSNYIRIIGNGSYMLGTEDIYTLNSTTIQMRMIETLCEIARGISDANKNKQGGQNDTEEFNTLIASLTA